MRALMGRQGQKWIPQRQPLVSLPESILRVEDPTGDRSLETSQRSMHPATNLILRNTKGNSFDVPVRIEWNGNTLVTTIKHTHNQTLHLETEASRD